MSRKDYIATAQVIRNVGRDDRAAREALRLVARGLAETFKADNSRFDRDRFFDACGL